MVNCAANVLFSGSGLTSDVSAFELFFDIPVISSRKLRSCYELIDMFS